MINIESKRWPKKLYGIRQLQLVFLGSVSWLLDSSCGFGRNRGELQGINHSIHPEFHHSLSIECFSVLATPILQHLYFAMCLVYLLSAILKSAWHCSLSCVTLIRLWTNQVMLIDDGKAIRLVRLFQNYLSNSCPPDGFIWQNLVTSWGFIYIQTGKTTNATHFEPNSCWWAYICSET